MTITVVIPTYNRNEQLSRVVDNLLVSDTTGVESIEIIVVDDGSPSPAKEVVNSRSVKEPFQLRYVRQENAGPAEARNNGFKHSSNELVLFIDDDILVFPDLIKRHAEAHREKLRSVIFGQSPYLESNETTPAYRYLNQLVDQSFRSVGAAQTDKYVRVDIVASGNLSVEKSLFTDRAVYAPGLKVPVGEEYELSAYLKERNIPIYFCPGIKGWHLQKATLEDTCIQNYKYGLGIAELAAKRPDVLERLEQPRMIFETNREIRRGDSLGLKVKKAIRSSIASEAIRKVMLGSTKLAERLIPIDPLLFAGYRLTIGTYFAAGIKDGITRFGKEDQ